jgi:hypothetical protein
VAGKIQSGGKMQSGRGRVRMGWVNAVRSVCIRGEGVNIGDPDYLGRGWETLGREGGGRAGKVETELEELVERAEAARRNYNTF